MEPRHVCPAACTDVSLPPWHALSCLFLPLSNHKSQIISHKSKRPPRTEAPLPLLRVARCVRNYLTKRSTENRITSCAGRNKKFLPRGVFYLFNCCTNVVVSYCFTGIPAFFQKMWSNRQNGNAGRRVERLRFRRLVIGCVRRPAAQGFRNAMDRVWGPQQRPAPVRPAKRASQPPDDSTCSSRPPAWFFLHRLPIPAFAFDVPPAFAYNPFHSIERDGFEGLEGSPNVQVPSALQWFQRSHMGSKGTVFEGRINPLSFIKVDKQWSRGSTMSTGLVHPSGDDG